MVSTNGQQLVFIDSLVDSSASGYTYHIEFYDLTTDFGAAVKSSTSSGYTYHVAFYNFTTDIGAAVKSSTTSSESGYIPITSHSTIQRQIGVLLSKLLQGLKVGANNIYIYYIEEI